MDLTLDLISGESSTVFSTLNDSKESIRMVQPHFQTRVSQGTNDTS
jgi:hypothetical protein